MCNFAKKCMSSLAYFVERASLHAFFAKTCVPFDLPYWKGRPYVHFPQKSLHVLVGLPF